MNRAIQRVARLAGLDPRAYRGQSCRIDAAQDLAAAGFGIGRIMLAGDGESDTMPTIYCRKFLPDRRGMAKLVMAQLGTNAHEGA